MEYRKSLEYQDKVTEIINDIFNIDGLIVDKKMNNENPILEIEKYKELLKNKIRNHNINDVKKIELHSEPIIDNYLNIDIKMETGTGKTYTYVKTIFELNKNYNIHKFIILVPSIAIKLGTKKFIEDSTLHFQNEYNKTISLHTQNVEKDASKNQPKAVKGFVNSSIVNEGIIEVLLLNDDYFKEKGNYGSPKEELINDTFITPADAIKSVRPFIIIDEPHRFKEEKTCMTFIKERIKPQCIIRFGATFNEYKNLVYDLNTKEAFNKNYIKGINVYCEGKKENDYLSFNIKNLKKGESVVIEYGKIGDNKNTKKDEMVKKGQLLNFLGDGFKGIKVEEISSKEITLSNGNSLKKDEIYTNYDYAKNTQESLLQVALNKHFEVEKQNFYRKNKIKTICLFFFDDIDAYRDRGKNVEQWLKNKFEKMLSKKLDEEISKIEGNNDDEILYKKYLEATKKNLKINDKYEKVHGGYFSDDKDKSDGSDFSQILVEKENTLNIYNKDNTFNTFRFIFCKWTLKEGWDNPNVFTIAKLSGSGPEISKLQEVGRGLRLPVDINMNRITDEEFYLNYIVNQSEKDFAEKLIKEVGINKLIEDGNKIYISIDLIKGIAIKLNKEWKSLLKEMINEDILDVEMDDTNGYEIIDKEKFDEKYSNYLELDNANLRNKINIGDNKTNGKTKIRKENFKKIEELWKILNQNFIIKYKDNAFDDHSMEELVSEVLKENKNVIFKEEVSQFEGIKVSEIIKEDKTSITDEDKNVVEINTHYYDKMKYSEYIKLISKETNIPILNIDKAIRDFIKTLDIDNYDKLFRKEICKEISRQIRIKKHKLINGNFEYAHVGNKKETFLTDDKGKMKNEVNSSYLGVNNFTGSAKISDKYLYEDINYDSDLERKNILEEVDDRIEVFGKIPKNSVRIPKIDGETCSPDFMYLLKDNNGKTKKMNLIVESKNYKSEEDMRETEKYTKEYMKKYFECLEDQVKDENISIKFDYQFQVTKMIDIINSILNE